MVYQDNREIKQVTKIYTFRDGRRVVQKETVEEYL